MGLLSRYGKSRADELKKLNTRSHAQIHASIFGVDRAEPEFYGDPSMEAWAKDWLGEGRPVVGINPFAGGGGPRRNSALETAQTRHALARRRHSHRARAAGCVCSARARTGSESGARACDSGRSTARGRYR